jgi:hypothetical protein
VSLPPPSDLEAEAVVLSVVLWGDATAHGLGLRPRQLWAPEHVQLWAVLLSLEELGRRPDLVLIARVLIAAAPDWPAEPSKVLGRLREIMSHAPLWGLAEHVERVADAARRRWVIRHLHRVEHLLRRGELPSERLARGLAAALTEMVDGRA